MSKVVKAVNRLEEQLRAEGYKGTQRALRLLKKLRNALKANGYSFDEPEAKRKRS